MFTTISLCAQLRSIGLIAVYENVCLVFTRVSPVRTKVWLVNRRGDSPQLRIDLSLSLAF